MQAVRRERSFGRLTWLFFMDWTAKLCLFYPVLLVTRRMEDVLFFTAGGLPVVAGLACLKSWRQPHPSLAAFERISAAIGRPAARVVCFAALLYLFSNAAVLLRLFPYLVERHLLPALARIPYAPAAFVPTALYLLLLLAGLAVSVVFSALCMCRLGRFVCGELRCDETVRALRAQMRRKLVLFSRQSARKWRAAFFPLGIVFLCLAAAGFRDEICAIGYYRALNVDLLLPFFLVTLLAVLLRERQGTCFKKRD